MAVPEVVQALTEYVDSLPPKLRDMPMLATIDGRILSPRQALAEVKAQTPAGSALERAILTAGIESLKV